MNCRPYILRGWTILLPQPAANSAYADELLFFFREGFLKKFVACGAEVRELTFLEAAPLMRAAPDVKRATLPLDYYSRLQSARTFLEGDRKSVV